MANPTLLVETFDGDAGDFTVSGPERYDNGLWLEEGTTNLMPNSTFEVDTSNVDVFWVTASVSTEDAVDGVQSLKGERNFADGYALWQNTAGGSITPGTTYTHSFYIANPDDLAQLAVNLQWKDAGGGNLSSPSSALVVSSAEGMTRRTMTATAPALADFVQALVSQGIGGSIGDYLLIDAWQIEAKPYATSFTTGTRAASSASVATTGHISPASGSLAFRSTRKIDTGAEEIILTVGTVGAATDAMRIGYDATDHPFMEWNSNGAGWQRVTATATVAADTEAFLYCDWSGTTIRCSVDNGALDSDTRAAVEDDWGAGDLTLSAATGSVVFNGFATFSDVLTAEQISTLYARPVWSLGTLDVNTYGRMRSQFELRPY